MWKLWTFNCIIVTTHLAFGFKNDSVTFGGNSWINNNDLKIIIDLSLPFSRCCNVFTDGETGSMDMIFNQFVQIYQFDYYMRHVSYECQGYFLITSSVDGIVQIIEKYRFPLSISTTELLIIIDNDIDSLKSFNISHFQNSNANILSKNSMWTLSENFLFPRNFKKVQRYNKLSYKNGIINLQGQQLQAAAFYNPPMCYLSTSVNRTVKGIDGEFFIATDEHELDGVEMKIFLLLAQKMNFTWLIRKPNHHYRYGRPNGTTWNGGMIGQIFRKEVDIAFSGIWLKHDQYRYVNLTEPWYQLFIHFLVPRPKNQPSFWSLTRPLSLNVWIAVIVMILLQSCNIYIKAWINPHVPQRFRSFTISITELIGRLLGVGASEKTHGLRIQMHLWHVAGVLVVTAYCSSLSARLSTPDYEPRIDTIRQFVEANLTWGREGPIPKFDDYFDLKDFYAKQLPSRFQSENNWSQRHEKIIKEKYAIVGRTVESIFFPENHIQHEDLVNYRLMKQSVGQYYTTFAVQPWLQGSVSKMMLWLKETGLIMYHLRNVIHRCTSPSLRDVLVEHDIQTDEAKPLILTPLGAGFVLLFAGYLLASIVFCRELRNVHKTGSIMQIIRRIEKQKKIN